ncbi:DUF808 domain-containing protein [Rhizobium cauense]|uniref:DUF808 domain-containing protein n=1 Tax=Rhizobium cauense TaxID=1166683 RepID=UPI001C6E28F7|nr:DUF808 domain-containing protein [Rhizobium cauense]MBW9118110.1 DUF808 domain-containing protein [Rhizobium cauense]
MATGLLALLDDIAAIAKLAAASLDDVAAQASRAGMKAAGVVIDDAAVTPRYVVGLRPERELPIIGKIALGSLKNKLLYLLPLCLVLGYFAPGWITPLLMIGGVYLAYEGTEKLYNIFLPHAAPDHGNAVQGAKSDPIAIENEKVAGAIRTDFILSAEIMALTLSQVATSSPWTQAAVLAAVGVLITLAVYGVVGLIVKADDAGLVLARRSQPSLLRLFGRALVKGMPYCLKVLGAIGTAAMLWVGGSIVLHGLAEFGLDYPEQVIHEISDRIAHLAGHLSPLIFWLVTASMQAILAILLGLFAIVGANLLSPLVRALARGKDA